MHDVGPVAQAHDGLDGARVPGEGRGLGLGGGGAGHGRARAGGARGRLPVRRDLRGRGSAGAGRGRGGARVLRAAGGIGGEREDDGRHARPGVVEEVLGHAPTIAAPPERRARGPWGTPGDRRAGVASGRGPPLRPADRRGDRPDRDVRLRPDPAAPGRRRGSARIVGIARRPFDPAEHGWTKMDYRRGDVRDAAALQEAFAGADVVVHLAFLITGDGVRARRSARSTSRAR